MKSLESLAARRRFGMRPGLNNIHRLLDALGNPERAIAAIHIAGTNGKGAVAAMCDSMLRAAGYSVGRYTSPHLVSLNERFFLNGEPVSDAILAPVVDEVLAVVEKIEHDEHMETTFFECLTAVAFLLYKRQGVKLVVLETGLGGRCDATNVVLPLISVITHIGLDHCEWLGDTLEAVAGEKAGIIKDGRPVVVAKMDDEPRAVIHRVAMTHHASFINVEDVVTVTSTKQTLTGQTLSISTGTRSLPPVCLPLAGIFQCENVATAIATMEALAAQGLPVSDTAMAQGLESVVWPGRFQCVCQDPIVIIDGAHNPDGAQALRRALKYLKIHRPTGLIAGYCGDKDVLAHLRIMSSEASVGWAVPIRNSRSLAPADVAERMILAGFTEAEPCVTLSDAMEKAKAWAKANNGIILICGSLFLASEALMLMDAFPWRTDRMDSNESSLSR